MLTLPEWASRSDWPKYNPLCRMAIPDWQAATSHLIESSGGSRSFQPPTPNILLLFAACIVSCLSHIYTLPKSYS
jgi:hypothetical protein